MAARSCKENAIERRIVICIAINHLLHTVSVRGLHLTKLLNNLEKTSDLVFHSNKRVSRHRR